MRPLARLQNSDNQQRYAVYPARLLCYYLRVLKSAENSAAEMSPDEQTESNDDIEETMSNDGSKAMGGETHNRETETVTDVFKDTCRLFP